ncbi:MAG: DUF1877 family protein [Proteobacteria bacterium]|nr:DUF1877 family protein [Pseudomonadota bacterium]
MGISISVLMATDDQIREFKAEPSRLENLLDRTISRDSDDLCRLLDYWDALHFMLTDQGRNTELPLAALKTGEVSYSDLSDPAHAIYSGTTKAFSRCLQELASSTLRQRFDLSKMADGGARVRTMYPSPRGILGRIWANGSYTDETFEELMTFLRDLREFVVQAAEQNKGLIFCRFEDW